MESLADIDPKSEISYPVPGKTNFLPKNIHYLTGSFAFLVVGLAVVFVTVISIPEEQNISSQASTSTDKSWITFDPSSYSSSPGFQTEPPPPPIVRIHKGGNRKISTMHLEFSYNPTFISNLSITLLDWAKNKPPVILEPLTTQVTGGQGKATITLGAPCDQKKCYPLKKAATNILMLNFNPLFSSQIDLTDNTIITMTGSSENTFDNDITQPLEVIATN